MKFNEGFHKMIEAAKEVSNNTKKIAVGATIIVGVAAGYNHENQKVKESENNKTEIKSEEAKINDILSRENINYVDAIAAIDEDIGSRLDGKLSEIQKDIEANPQSFLDNFEKFRNIKEFNLAKEILKIAESKPGYFLKRASRFYGIEGLDVQKEIIKIADMYPFLFLDCVSDLKDIKNLNLAEEISKASKKEPYSFLDNASQYKNIIGLDLASEITKAARVDHSKFLSKVTEFKDIKGLNLPQEILVASEKNPFNFLEHAKEYKDIVGLDLASEIPKAADKEPGIFLVSASEFKDINGLEMSNIISKAAEKESYIFLKYALNFKDIKGLNLAQEITKAADKDPGSFLENASNFRDIMNLNFEEEVLKAAKKSPNYFLKIASQLKDLKNFNLAQEIVLATHSAPSEFLYNAYDFLDIQDINIAEEITRAAAREPGAFLENASEFKQVKNLKLAEEISKAAQINPENFLTNASKFQNIDGLNIANEILRAAESEPKEFFRNVSEFGNIEGLDLFEEISKISQRDPEFFLNSFHRLKHILPETKKMELLAKSLEADPESFQNVKEYLDDKEKNNFQNIKFLEQIKNNSVMPLYHLMVNDNLSEIDAQKIVDNKSEFMKMLIKIKSTPGHLGGVSVERHLRNMCLHAVYEINSLHEAGEERRFKSVENFDAKELYNVMVYGEQEIFTSSFNGLFNRLIPKLSKKNGLNGKDLLNQVGLNGFRTFIKECASFNRLNEFLATMDKNEADNLLIQVVKNLEMSKDKLQQAVTVADIIGTTDDPKTLKLLRKQVKFEFERVSANQNSKDDKIMYGLLCSMIKGNSAEDINWFNDKSNEYPIENVSEIKSRELFSEKGVCVQKYCFFESGDKDGLLSFENFMKSYQNDSRWNINKGNKNFIIITGKNNGKTVEIYANIPQINIDGMAGIEEMNKFLESKKAKINVYTYRGHSFGFNINGDISSAKIVNIGSCGGYNNMSKVLEASPNAHIISTQGTGSRFVNDPILYSLNNAILSGENIVWKDLWNSLSSSLKNNPNFRNYVPPHKNQGAMFIQNFNHLKRGKI